MTYQAGQKLGNYQLIRLLGQGGFAEVYLGKHMYLDTHAAIKVLQKQSDNEALESFLQEARIIASLKHPHIVGVLEFGIEEQRPFLVMEYAMYGTLRQRYLRGRPLSPTAILLGIRQVAEALQYAHERKIIHRDVKPENMLLDRNHRVLLSDFGLALRTRSSYHSIDYANSGGTISYMSPEQLQGKPGAASDQYALGVVMYEWLCGCLPFDGPDVSIVVQHLHEPPVPLRMHVPTLSLEVEAVVLRALEKDPKQRFATVQELAEAFEKACNGLPVLEERDEAHYKDAQVPSEAGELLQDEVSNTVVRLLPGRVQDEIPQGDARTPLFWPAPSPSLQAPSLDASLNVNRPLQNTQKADSLALTASKSTPSSQKRARISRRIVAVGIAGLVLGGVGIWRLSASGNVIHSINAQSVQGGSSGVTIPGLTTNRQGAGKSGTSGTSTTGRTASSPASGNGTTKSGTTNPATPGKSGQTGATSTPTSSNSGSSVATSTPGTSAVTPTPVATDAPGKTPVVPLTLQLNHAPSSVRNRTTVNISIATNMSALSFQFEADYYDVFGNLQQQQQSDILNGTTDNNGNAIVNWTPTLLPNLLFARNYANLYVTAADQNGHTVSSRHVRVQITSF